MPGERRQPASQALSQAKPMEVGDAERFTDAANEIVERLLIFGVEFLVPLTG
jgi:hypothetical protein